MAVFFAVGVARERVRREDGVSSLGLCRRWPEAARSAGDEPPE